MGEDAPAVVIGVDTGGTFTDVYAADGRVYKLPSTPDRPSDAIVAGLEAIGVGPGASVAHGTTVATNAVLERKGARTALLTTAGFEDVLAIRRQNRPALYDLWARWPDPLAPETLRFGVPERLDFRGAVLEPLDEEAVRQTVRRLCEMAVEAVAVCLLYAYVNPCHEQRVAALLREGLGPDIALSLSHEIAPQYFEYERTSTTVVNAFVMPVMRAYLSDLIPRVVDLGAASLHVMHSNGGLISAETAAARPVLTVLSGPAAGVVGAYAQSARAGREEIITFDMGGTSTDVAMVPGEVLERSDGEIGSFPLLVPMLTIETVGAGGGSIARVDDGGRLHVGPESAGAVPGPAAYGRGTEPTVTDANLVLGRLSPRGLLGGAMTLDVEAARDALLPIASTLGVTLEEAAWSVIRLANSNMERAVRTVTQQRGHDPRRFTLVPFGGAGPLHGAELADGLGITRILIPPRPGIMCAYGLTVPDLQRDFYRTILLALDEQCTDRVETAFFELEREARAELAAERTKGFGEPIVQRFVDVRYRGQSFDLRLPYIAPAEVLYAEFAARYRERYGYATPGAPAEIVNVRVRATLPRLVRPHAVPPWPEAGPAEHERNVWFGGVALRDLREVRTRILWRSSLPAGSVVAGPAVLDQYDSTSVVPPGWQARVDEQFNLLLDRIST